LELTYKEISELQEAVKEASSENDEIKDHLSTAQKAMDNLIEGLNQVSDRLQENNEDLANEIEANYILEEQNAKLEKKLKKWKIFGFSSGGANIVLIALLIILL
jgi:DNA-binding ferritin-like protein